MTTTTKVVSKTPFVITERCDFYRAKHTGRNALPEEFNEMFVSRFVATTSLCMRDFSDLIVRIHSECRQRDIDLERQEGEYALFRAFVEIWQQCRKRTKTAEAAARLYCDIFVAAILGCPKTQFRSIYE